MLENQTLLDSRYEVISKIGQGGMSYVYKALDRKLNRFVALKVLKEEFSSDEEFVQKFRKEAQSVASLVHPNIVAAYDAVDEGELHYIVMELVEGRSLKYRIQHRGMIGNDSAIEIALQTAEGIAAAHRNGIIHRDIKPQNIIISRDGTVKVADFGIAKAVTGETISTAVLGSAHYVSPEQAKKGVSDERSDIYSLGITMYEMVTGVLPFDGENTVSVVMAHINKQMVPPEEMNPDVWPSFNDIILKATRKNPNDRYQTADEMIADLKKCKEDPYGDFVFPETAETQQFSNGNHKKTEQPAGKVKFSRNVLIVLVSAALVGILIATGIFIISDEAESGSRPPQITAAGSTETDTNVSIEIAENMTLPSVVGMTTDEAKVLLNTRKVSMVVEKEEYNEIYLAGIIIRQNPEEGASVNTGDKVFVTVSLGSKLDSVLKSLKGISVEEATERLKEVDVSVLGIDRQFSNDVEEGLVIGYILNDNPDTEKASAETEETQVASEELTGTKINKGSSIVLLISAGKESEGAHVPSLLGLEAGDAAAVLESSGLHLGTIQKIASGSSRDGRITAQSEPVNEPVKKGTSINVVVNWNPEDILSYETGQTVFTDPNEEEELSPEFWYGSIDTSYLVGTTNGPSESDKIKNIGIRLHQRMDDNDEYSVIAEPRPISAGTRMPVSYRSIRGAQGVNSGIVEVYDADTDTVLQSYQIQFYPLQQ